MRASTFVAVAFIALILAGPSASASRGIDFAAPAQFGGHLQVQGAEWALVLTHPGMAGHFELSSTLDMALREFHRNSLAEFRLLGNTGKAHAPEDTSTVGSMPSHVNLQSDAWSTSSFFVEASTLSLEVAQSEGSLDVTERKCLDFWLPYDREVRNAVRGDALCQTSNSIVVLRQGLAAAPLAFIINGSQVNELEWHNMHTSCIDSEQCPTGGTYTAKTVPVGADHVRQESRIYENAVGEPQAQLNASGHARIILIGGPALQVAVSGWVRLPLASTDAGCTTCLDVSNRTFIGTGEILLGNLRPSEFGRMGSDLSGTLTSARIDEGAVDPFLLLGANALPAGAAMIGLVALIKFLLMPLFTRLSKDQALEHPRRKQIFEYIQRHPGANFREVARNTSIAAGTVRHHLNVLERAGQVVEHSHGSTVRLFENHGKFQHDWADLVLLREPALGKLHAWLKDNPGSPQKAVLEAMEVEGWSRSTTQHRLSRLVDGGIASIRLQGRLKLYSLADRPASLKPLGLLPQTMREQPQPMSRVT